MLAAAFVFAAGLPVRLSAQTTLAPRVGGEGAGVVSDWSHRHVVFSNPGTEEAAIQKGPAAHARWLKVTSDPRYLMQAKLRSTADHSTSETPAGSEASAATADSAFAGPRSPSPGRPVLQTHSPIKRDWSLSLGGGSVAPNMSPAKFSFDSDAGPLTVANCTSAFVVYGLNVAGTASQANLVGIDNLYSGTSPTGLCGTVPTYKWAYNVSTLSGGTVTTSPALSPDGSMVAFIESNGSATVLHVLRWTDGDGTVTLPATDLVGAPSAFACTAPCMSSTTLGAAKTTISSPFYDFLTDNLYVGNDAGQLFVVNGVFGGTPTVSSTVTVASGVVLTGPVLDFVSGNVFVGGSDGNLYAMTTPGHTVSHIAVGSGDPQGGGIVDAPLVDQSIEMVTAFTAANATNVGGTVMTANTHALAVQTDSAGPFASTHVATLGVGTSGTATNLNVLDGTFDDTYFNYSGTGANTGVLYGIGTAAGTTAPTAYQIAFSGVASVTVNTNGGGYTTPVVSITGGTVAATATASGGVDALVVSAGGTGYTSIPTMSFVGTGTGAAASASVGVNAIAVTGAGSGFTSVPTVAITGTGSGGAGTASMGVNTVGVTANGTGYTAIPTTTFTGGAGTGAAATSSVGVNGVTISANGSGYTSIPTVSFTGSGAGGGAGTVSVGVSAIAVSASGLRSYHRSHGQYYRHGHWRCCHSGDGSEYGRRDGERLRVYIDPHNHFYRRRGHGCRSNIQRGC